MTAAPDKWGFTPGLWNVATKDGHNFFLLDNYYYRTKAGKLITIPRGSDSDGASTPRAIWNVLPPFGDYWKAAYLHDFLYRKSKLPKEYCDAMLKEAMESLGVNDTELITIYTGVKIGGQEAFDEDRGIK